MFYLNKTHFQLKKKILIMGLPGSGKTYLAKRFSKKVNAEWLNADKIRGKYNDWDFSKKGIIRQVERMKNLAQQSQKNIVVADFVCPLKEQINIFKPSIIVWMDTIKKGRFSSMNKLFKPPKNYDLRFKEKNVEVNLIKLHDKLKTYNWDNKKHTVQMLGRWQPWHEGHRKLFEKSIVKTGQVNILVRDVYGLGDNPFSFIQVKKNIDKDLKDFKFRYKISKVPNITNIVYGRTVGYKIQKINLGKKIEKISATKIRRKLRKLKKL